MHFVAGCHLSASCCYVLTGDIAFLEMSDVDSLNLPKLAQDTVTTYVQQKLCRPPLLLDLGITMATPNMSTQVTCQMLFLLLVTVLCCFIWYLVFQESLTGSDVLSCARLPKKVLYGQVKGGGVVGRPQKIWNDVLLSDTQILNITCPHSDAQNKSAWKAKTVIART